MIALTRRVCIFLTLGGALVAHSTAAQGNPTTSAPAAPTTTVDLLHHAQSLYDDGVNSAHQNVAAARELFRQSADEFSRAIERGAHSAAVEYNLGNACFRAGDMGGAVLHLRRAQRQAPSDADIAANLDHVREHVTPQIAPSGRSQLAQRLLAWHYQTSVGARWLTALSAGVIGWTLLFIRLRRRNGLLLTGALAGIVVAAASAGSLLYQLHYEFHEPDAIVMVTNQTLRNGRGEGYDAVLREALNPGVEVRVLETRADWVRVKLANDAVGWLPATTIERVWTS